MAGVLGVDGSVDLSHLQCPVPRPGLVRVQQGAGRLSDGAGPYLTALAQLTRLRRIEVGNLVRTAVVSQGTEPLQHFGIAAGLAGVGRTAAVHSKEDGESGGTED